MRTINIHEAKTHLSRLLERVSAGDSFIIAKAGNPVAKLVPLDAASEKQKQRLGFLEGEFIIPDDFNEMGKGEIEQLFAGGDA
jgi:prevent-host-death family protein